MVMTEQDSRLAARIKLVEEHVDAENDHDLDRLMATFGAAPTYALNTEHFLGQDGVRSWYAELMQGFPDFRIDVQHQHDSADAITLEVIVRGTHRGELLGIPPTGKEITLAAMETYRLAGGKIAEQWVVIDALGLMQQLGAIGVPGQASP